MRCSSTRFAVVCRTGGNDAWRSVRSCNYTPAHGSSAVSTLRGGSMGRPSSLGIWAAKQIAEGKIPGNGAVRSSILRRRSARSLQRHRWSTGPSKRITGSAGMRRRWQRRCIWQHENCVPRRPGHPGFSMDSVSRAASHRPSVTASRTRSMSSDVIVSSAIVGFLSCVVTR